MLAANLFRVLFNIFSDNAISTMVILTKPNQMFSGQKAKTQTLNRRDLKLEYAVPISESTLPY